MPKGVEHQAEQERKIQIEQALFVPLMPKGVEHLPEKDLPYSTPYPVCSVDAERR